MTTSSYTLMASYTTTSNYISYSGKYYYPEWHAKEKDDFDSRWESDRLENRELDDYLDSLRTKEASGDRE